MLSENNTVYYEHQTKVNLCDRSQIIGNVFEDYQIFEDFQQNKTEVIVY